MSEIARAAWVLILGVTIAGWGLSIATTGLIDYIKASKPFPRVSDTEGRKYVEVARRESPGGGAVIVEFESEDHEIFVTVHQISRPKP